MASNVLISAASEVKSQFSILKEVDSSNTVFKLFSKVTVGLCVIASILVATSEYLGSPIQCQNSAGKVNDDVYNAYCWIHGGKKISGEASKLWKCYHPSNEPKTVSFTKTYRSLLIYTRKTFFELPLENKILVGTKKTAVAGWSFSSGDWNYIF